MSQTRTVAGGAVRVQHNGAVRVADGNWLESKCAVRVERRIGFESMLERWVRLKGYCAADFGGVDCDQAYICADVKSTSSS